MNSTVDFGRTAESSACAPIAMAAIAIATETFGRTRGILP
jgi:hypothetical protein